MPNVTAPTRSDQNGQSYTYFLDSVSTTSTTYTYPAQQDDLTVTNKGAFPITLTVNGTTYTIQGGGVQSVPTLFTSFSIVATGQTAFDAMAISETTNSADLGRLPNESMFMAGIHDVDVNASLTIIDPQSLCMIQQASPTTATANPTTFSLNNATNAVKSALIKYDVTPLNNGKPIFRVFLRLYVDSGSPNETRTVKVGRALRPWTTAATWNTYDGTNAWTTAGGLDSTSDVTPNLYRESIFRPTVENAPWCIDVTELVKNWVSGTWANNGLSLSIDSTGIDTSLRNNHGFNLLPYGKPGLFVIYADNDNAHGALSPKDKAKIAFSSMTTTYQIGRFLWQHGQGKNAMARAHEVGWGFKYLDALQTVYSQFVNTNGTLTGYANTGNLSQLLMAQPLLYLYKVTNKSMWQIAAQNYRTQVNSLPTESGSGLIQYDGAFGVLTELSYHGLVFIAGYGDLFNDSASTDLAMNQVIGLYDAIQQPDGVPYHTKGSPASKGWGRGIGWLIVGMAKMLKYKSVQSHSRYGELKSRFVTLCATLRNYQNDNGMWRSIIHDNTKPFETSGTAMIALSFEIGVQLGLLLVQPFLWSVNQSVRALWKYSIGGFEISSCFPDNIDGNFSAPLTRTTFGQGAWLELLVEVWAR